MVYLKSSVLVRSFWGLAFVLFLAVSGFAPASAADKAKKADEQTNVAAEQTKKADEAANKTEEAASKVVFHVDQNDPKVMNLTLNNVQNLLKYFKKTGGKVTIEVVTYGPGLNMLRKDKTPVAKRITAIAKENSDVQFSACKNTIAVMTKKAKGKKPPLVDEAKEVPSGVVRLLELHQQGYAYIKP
jgi:intracellular sulfur oxidation DsrE/DsrF family protein